MKSGASDLRWEGGTHPWPAPPTLTWLSGKWMHGAARPFGEALPVSRQPPRVTRWLGSGPGPPAAHCSHSLLWFSSCNGVRVKMSSILLFWEEVTIKSPGSVRWALGWITHLQDTTLGLGQSCSRG